MLVVQNLHGDLDDAKDVKSSIGIEGWDLTDDTTGIVGLHTVQRGHRAADNHFRTRGEEGGHVLASLHHKGGGQKEQRRRDERPCEGIDDGVDKVDDVAESRRGGEVGLGGRDQTTDDAVGDGGLELLATAGEEAVGDGRSDDTDGTAPLEAGADILRDALRELAKTDEAEEDGG